MDILYFCFQKVRIVFVANANSENRLCYVILTWNIATYMDVCEENINMNVVQDLPQSATPSLCLYRDQKRNPVSYQFTNLGSAWGCVRGPFAIK